MRSIYCEKKTWANKDHKNCALSYAKNEGGLFPSFISVLGNLDNRGKAVKALRQALHTLNHRTMN